MSSVTFGKAMKKLTLLIFTGISIALSACREAPELFGCGEYRVLKNTLRQDAPIPSVIPRSVSLFSLPTTRKLELGNLGKERHTRVSFKSIDFQVPGGCYPVGKLMNIGRDVQPGDRDFCFAEDKQLTFHPASITRPKCDDPICADDPELSRFAKVLSEISIELQKESDQIVAQPFKLGSIRASETEYKIRYDVSWQRGREIAVFNLSVNSANGDLSLQGVYADRSNPSGPYCRPSDVAAILDIIAN